LDFLINRISECKVKVFIQFVNSNLIFLRNLTSQPFALIYAYQVELLQNRFPLVIHQVP
jgi:hypothetical protein